MSDRPVVVGVDGWQPSLAAADLAAELAARRGLALEIVHAYAPPLLVGPVGSPPDLPPVGPAPEIVESALRESADALLHEAGQQVRTSYPDLAVVTRRHDGPPAEVLLTASHHASVIVVGHRGNSGFTELLIGSTGLALANHAACPVIVARGRPTPQAPVVVGVDGSDSSQRAASFAAQAAGWYQVPLVAMYAWTHDPGWEPAMAQAGQPPPGVPEEVSALVAQLTDAYPQLSVVPRLQQEQPPSEALLEASQDARLVVVGTRGRGGFKGLLLGSVSHALLHHAECPVAVIGPEQRDASDTPVFAEEGDPAQA